MKNFKIAKFRLKIDFLQRKNFSSYPGSTLRGGFGYSFKKVACIAQNRECKNCLLREKCVYSYIFETPVPPNTKFMRKYEKAPKPFVIEPPEIDSEIESEIEFGLVLIGKAIDYLPYFIYTFEKFGENGIGRDRIKFTLNNVKCSISGNVIYNNSDKKLIQDYKLIRFEDLEIEDYKIKNKLKINFLTPVRIKFNEKLTEDLQFHIIIRNLLRRIALLSYFHCNEELNINFKEMIERAKNVKIKKKDTKWVEFERYSTRQKEKLLLGGVVGEIEYEGEIEEFLPYLLLGEYTHIGKACTFGFGKYEIIREEK